MTTGAEGNGNVSEAQGLLLHDETSLSEVIHEKSCVVRILHCDILCLRLIAPLTMDQTEVLLAG